jgi:hypothetical protein
MQVPEEFPDAEEEVVVSREPQGRFRGGASLRLASCDHFSLGVWELL